jgi:tubulin-folding cofactor B
MSMQTAGDIPLQVTSENSSSERRITPSWTIGHLKAKLEPVTGIPPQCQKLTLRVSNHQGIPIEAADEENTQLSRFPLAPYAELHVSFPCRATGHLHGHVPRSSAFHLSSPHAYVQNIF